LGTVFWGACPKTYDLQTFVSVARIVSFRSSYLIPGWFVGRHSFAPRFKISCSDSHRRGAKLPIMAEIWYYYGIFCKCWSFLPLWEAPKEDTQVFFGLPFGTWRYDVFCDGCGASVELSADTRVFLVESSRQSVRFRASKSVRRRVSSS
jgi:hypothetical protein